jgi:hypothetical protein
MLSYDQEFRSQLLVFDDKFTPLYYKSLNLRSKILDARGMVLEECDVLILSNASFVPKRHGPRSTPLKTIGPTSGLTVTAVQFDAIGKHSLSIPVGYPPAKKIQGALSLLGRQIVIGLQGGDGG